MANRERHIYAWVGEDLRGVEGIIMIPEPGSGSPLPLVSMDRKHMMIVRRHARAAAVARHSKLYLVRYVESEIVDTIETE